MKLGTLFAWSSDSWAWGLIWEHPKLYIFLLPRIAVTVQWK